MQYALHSIAPRVARAASLTRVPASSRGRARVVALGGHLLNHSIALRREGHERIRSLLADGIARQATREAHDGVFQPPQSAVRTVTNTARRLVPVELPCQLRRRASNARHCPKPVRA